MGKQQKLKEIRREARMVDVEQKKPWGLYAVSVLLAVGAVFLGYKVFKGNVQPSASVSSSPDVSVAATAAPFGSPESFVPVVSNTAIIKTSKGDITLELYHDVAPTTVENFVKLAKEKFYEGTKFHRVLADFMIQGGDPNSKDSDPSNDGQGGPGYTFADEIDPRSLGVPEDVIKQYESQGYKYDFNLHSLPVDPGYIAMANRGPDTNGSQFFIVTTQPQQHLYGKHTVFGKVIKGMDVVLKIAQGDVIKSVTIK
jgi:peptidyl-prolyl cis-trans isomerase B (cyclophilin B)